MKRSLAALLTCALIAFGQRSRPATAPTVRVPWIIDAVVVDASGLPVTDLTPAEFQLVHGGRPQKISHFTWFDTRLHTAKTPPELLPALELAPDEIRLNLVAVVDDLGMSAPEIDAARNTLRTFVTDSMSSGDKMAVLRSSGGSGMLQQLTGDHKVLADSIAQLQYLGGSTSAALAGRASWEALNYALDGLRDAPGRNVVALISQNLDLRLAQSAALVDAAKAAHTGGVAVYALRALPGGSSVQGAALESLARDTGGLFDTDFARVLRQERGYYVIGFLPNEDLIDLSGGVGSTPLMAATLKVLRPGLVVHTRTGFLHHATQVESHAPVEQSALLGRALRSPFTGSQIRARLTAGHSGAPNEDLSVTAILHFDARGLSFVHDLQDIYHADALLSLAAYTDDGLSPSPQVRDYTLNLRPDDYRKALQYGLRFSLSVKVPRPGAWQIRALVADRASDRVGSADQFVEVPNLRQGAFAISGLTFGGPETDKGVVDPLEDAGIRSFKAGHICTFEFVVFNPMMGIDKQSRIDMRSRIFSGGKLVMEGGPTSVAFGDAGVGTRRQISGKLSLDPKMLPGQYVLQIMVKDLNALPGKERTMTQFIEFQVRE